MNKKSKIILIVVSSIVLLTIVFLAVIGAGFLSFLIEIFSLVFILIGLGFRYGKKKLKIILSAIIVIVTLVLINMNMTNSFKNRIDNLTWYPQYFIIWIFPLLFVAMALVVKYCKKKLKIALSIIILLITLWSIIFAIDTIRYKNGKEPIFQIKSRIYDYSNGYIHEHIGIGYKYIEYDFDVDLIVNLRSIELVPFWVKTDLSPEYANINHSQKQFKAKIIEVHSNGNLVVEPNEDEQIRKSADKISFDWKVYPDIVYEIGMNVKVIYTGEIMESYPAQINAIWVSIE